MVEYRKFTEQERRTIDSIYARNCEGLSSDEVQLLIAWENMRALHNAEFQAEQERLDALMEAEKAAKDEEHAQAMENLELTHQAALARLAAVRGENVS